MFELLALGAVAAFGIYYFLGHAESKDLTSAPLDARFESALKDVVGDRALFAAVVQDSTPDPTGAPPSDEAIKKQAMMLEERARVAWNSGDPHELANMVAELRTGLKFNAPVESKKKLVTLTTVFRDKIDSLTSQGALVDTFFAKIDKIDMTSPEAMMKLDPAEMQAIADDVATVDFAALAPYTALIDENSIHSADVEGKDGLLQPVYSKVHLYTLNTSQKIETPVTVELRRYVKRVVAANGAAASVFVGVVTSAVPNEYYNKQVFVFAPVGVVTSMEPSPLGPGFGDA